MENLIYIESMMVIILLSGSIQGMEPGTCTQQTWPINVLFIGGAYIVLSVFQAPNEVSSAYMLLISLNNEKLQDIT